MIRKRVDNPSNTLPRSTGRQDRRKERKRFNFFSSLNQALADANGHWQMQNQIRLPPFAEFWNVVSTAMASWVKREELLPSESANSCTPIQTIGTPGQEELCLVLPYQMYIVYSTHHQYCKNIDPWVQTEQLNIFLTSAAAVFATNLSLPHCSSHGTWQVYWQDYNQKNMVGFPASSTELELTAGEQLILQHTAGLH